MAQQKQQFGKSKNLLPGEADYRQGDAYYRQNKLVEALFHFLEAARQNYPASYLRLGKLYLEELTVPKNEQLSKAYYQKVSKNIRWFLTEAEKGLPDAQFNLGECYESGFGVDEDFNKAMELYQSSANQGHSYAEYRIAVRHDKGEGVPKNPEMAVQWYTKAALQGHVDAQYDLACCFQNGEGVPINFKEAAFWFKKAAQQGDQGAQLAFNNLLADHPELINDFSDEAMDITINENPASFNGGSDLMDISEDGYSSVFPSLPQNQNHREDIVGNIYQSSLRI